jgi:5'-nucleotidase
MTGADIESGGASRVEATPAGASPQVESQVVIRPQATVPPHPTRVLVTNDDGVDSPGIARLAAALATEFDVTVAAPSEDWSGAGTSIGRFDAQAGIPMRRVQLDGQLAYAIDGPPGLAVLAAALGAFGDPFDVVVSGINAGINTGNSVIHSGTVGAGLTARTFGAHGVAVSLVPSDPWHWDTAAEIGLAAARWVTSHDRRPTTLSINVPSLPLGQVRGLRRAELTDVGYFRVAIANEGAQKLEFEVMSGSDTAPEGSDTWLLGQGFATISVLGELVAASGELPSDLGEVWTP